MSKIQEISSLKQKNSKSKGSGCYELHAKSQVENKSHFSKAVKLHYTIPVYLNTWKKHAHQINNLESKV